MKRTRRIRIAPMRTLVPDSTPAELLCRACGCAVLALGFAQAAHLQGTDQTGVAQLAAGGWLHLVATPGGDARVCARSLLPIPESSLR